MLLNAEIGQWIFLSQNPDVQMLFCLRREIGFKKMPLLAYLVTSGQGLHQHQVFGIMQGTAQG